MWRKYKATAGFGEQSLAFETVVNELLAKLINDCIDKPALGCLHLKQLFSWKYKLANSFGR